MAIIIAIINKAIGSEVTTDFEWTSFVFIHKITTSISLDLLKEIIASSDSG